MSSVQTEGETFHGTATEERMPEGLSEHEKWAYQKEPHSAEWERRVAKEMVGGGSFVGALGGLGAIALGILAILSVVPQYLNPIAIMALGVAMAFESALVIMRHGHTPLGIHATPWATLQFFAGMGGSVLGLLALIGLNPTILMSASLIVLGGGLLLGSGLTARLSNLEAAKKTAAVGESHARSWRFALVTLPVVTVQVLCSLGVIALGILAVCGIAVTVLSAIAILTLGGVIFLSGTAVSSRIIRI
jgi:hypothetical protein